MNIEHERERAKKNRWKVQMLMYIKKWKYYEHSQMEHLKEQEKNWDREHLSVSQVKLVDQIKQRGKSKKIQTPKPRDEAADLHTESEIFSIGKGRDPTLHPSINGKVLGAHTYRTLCRGSQPDIEPYTVAKQQDRGMA
jgi:hypothetical protein